jgi:hypothetical protein
MGKMGIMKGMSSLHNLENCMVCGSRLDYRKKSGEMTCAYCGRVEQGHITCPDGHFICEACHGRDAMQAIENLAFSAGSSDPLEIAEFMMSIPNLPMLGCQHAFIAAVPFAVVPPVANVISVMSDAHRFRFFMPGDSAHTNVTAIAAIQHT